MYAYRRRTKKAMRRVPSTTHLTCHSAGMANLSHTGSTSFMAWEWSSNARSAETSSTRAEGMHLAVVWGRGARLL